MLDHIIKSSTPALLGQVLDINPANAATRRRTLIKYARQIEALAKAQGIEITLQKRLAATTPTPESDDQEYSLF